jgi:hypothetical protein
MRSGSSSAMASCRASSATIRCPASFARSPESRYRMEAVSSTWESCASVCVSSDRVTIWNSTAATAIIGMTTMTRKKSRSRFLNDGVTRLRRRMRAAVRTGNLAAERLARAWLPGYNRRFTAHRRNPAGALAGL